MGRRGHAIGGTPSCRPPRSDTARAGDIYGMTVSVRQGRVAADPIGVALLITAGKRSAPADRLPTPFRPHGGSHFIPTSCGALAGDCTALSAGVPAAYPR